MVERADRARLDCHLTVAGGVSRDLAARARSVSVDVADDVAMISQGRVASSEFEAVYVDGGGAERRVPWAWMPEVVDKLDRASAVVPVAPRSAQLSGLVLVGHGGPAGGLRVVGRADHLVALDFDPSVVAMVSQPFWLLPGP